jgi:hypothetical protein
MAGENGTNSFNVSVPPLDFTKKHAPTSQTYHGITIKVNGKVVGRISNWTVNVYQRTVTHVRELNAKTFGRPIDIVPSINDGYTITANRTEVWGEELEKAVGYSQAFDDLINQTYPFSIQELWFKGVQIYRITDYHGCWFTNTDLESWDVTGDAIVKRSCAIMFCSKSISLGK